MGFFDLLDPTRSWPSVEGPAPDLTFLSYEIEALPFGSPIDSARFLGRPDAFEWESRMEKRCALLYARKGLRLRFGQGKLRDVAYLVGLGATDHPAFERSQPLAPDGTRLSDRVDRARIVAMFGEPDPQGSDNECLQVFHQGRGAASDFYLDERGNLREWAIYPDD